jgi:hypothetical protein
VYIRLQSEGRKRHGTAEVGNLKNKRSEGGTGGRKCRLREEQNTTYLLLQCTTHNGGVSSY